MADHPIRVFLNYSGEWTEVTTDVSQVEAVKLAQGGSEVSAAPKPSTISLTFEDPDGVYRPYLPSSPLYDLAGRNTPLLIGADMGTEDFEDTTYNFTWGFAGTGVWDRSSTQAHAGTWSFKSASIANGQQSNWQIDMPVGTTSLVFWYWTDISSGSFLAVYNEELDLIWSAAGNSGGWHQATVDMSGSNAVLFSYQRNAASGTNACYVDDLLALAGQIGEVASWEPDSGNPGDPPSTDVTASGLLGRIGRWTEPIESAMRRWVNGRSDLVDYWPCSDTRAATSIASATGGRPGQAETGFKLDTMFGQEDAPGGSDAAIQIGDESALIAVTRRSSVGNGQWTMLWAFKLTKPVPPGNPGMPIFLIEMPNFWSATVYIFEDEYELDVLSPFEGTEYDESQFYTAADSPNQWILMAVSMTRSGTTNSIRWSWYPQDGTVRTFTGTADSPLPIPPVDWRINANANILGAQYSEIMMLSTSSLFTIDTDLQDAFDGYLGELAGTRFLRLLEEQGLSGILYGFTEDTEPMGRQRPDTLINLLREIRDTEAGVITDSPGQVSVSLRGRISLYNQDAVALTYGTDIAASFRPVLDDLNTHNLITVSQRDGGTVTAEDTTSRMGTQVPPNGVGVYKQSIDVNVDDESRLPNLASWWRAIGTNPEPRFTAITVDLDANPALEDAVTAARGGDRITVAGYLPDLIDLIVIGKADTRANQKRRTVTFTCAPYRSYDVAIQDGDKRQDSYTSTLNAGYNTTDATMVVTFTVLADQWSTVNEPYDWIVAGERITVTSMGAVTGSGPWTQSATVTRSVNGVVKSHLTGEPVRMHPDQQARQAL